MEIRISVIGGGASCIAFIDTLTDCYLESAQDPLKLTIVEKNSTFGPGNAYRSDIQSNLLNTKAGYITAFKDKSGDFFRWLHENKLLWQPLYPGLEVGEDSYAPRSLFGMYMEDSFSSAIFRAERNNIQVELVAAEASGLVRDTERGQLKVKTSCDQRLLSDIVVLACGTLSNAQGITSGKQTIHSDPYPTDSLVQKIGLDDDVSIIGARLSAIDTVIGLVERGHRGQIFMHSRSGFFPSVRGTQERYKNHYLTDEYIQAHCPEVTLATLTGLFHKEMERYRSLHEDAGEDIQFPIPEIEDFGVFLDEEIERSGQARGWQAVLYDTNKILHKVWNWLPEHEKSFFMRELLPAAMSLRVSIPRENAQKMRKYLESGQLHFIPGSTKIESTPDGRHNVVCKDKERLVDAIVYATGSPRKIEASNSTLIKSMVDNGYATRHPFGGIDVKADDYAILNSDGHQSDLYAIGEITNGRFLFTSAMDIIVTHAHNCALVVSKQLFSKESEKLAVYGSLQQSRDSSLSTDKL